MDKGNSFTHPDENYVRSLPDIKKANHTDTIKDLVSAIRSINHSRHHEVSVPGDDEVCYFQRKEWVEWLLEKADTAEQDIS